MKLGWVFLDLMEMFVVHYHTNPQSSEVWFHRTPVCDRTSYFLPIMEGSRSCVRLPSCGIAVICDRIGPYGIVRFPPISVPVSVVIAPWHCRPVKLKVCVRMCLCVSFGVFCH